MNEPKLIDFPVEEHEPAALEVMLAGCATDAERKAVREAFYTFAQGDPGAFAVQLAVLLTAHARALKTAPEAFRKAGERVSSEVVETIASHGSRSKKPPPCCPRRRPTSGTKRRSPVRTFASCVRSSLNARMHSETFSPAS